MKYQSKRAKMAADPGFRRSVIQSQVASRQRRRLTQWLEHVKSAGHDAACSHVYPSDRHCWKTEPHTHGGFAYRSIAEVETIYRRAAAGMGEVVVLPRTKERD